MGEAGGGSGLKERRVDLILGELSDLGVCWIGRGGSGEEQGCNEGRDNERARARTRNNFFMNTPPKSWFPPGRSDDWHVHLSERARG